MITSITFKELVSKYGLDSDKIIKNNENLLEYGNYRDIEESIKYLQSIEIPNRNIENAPSLLTLRTASNLKKNYEFLIKTDKIKKQDIVNCVHILSTDNIELITSYYYVSNNYKNMFPEHISCLKLNSNDIKDVLDLSYWKDEKYRPLLTSSIWNSNPSDIKEMLGLEYWKDEKYKPLLTSNIWKSNPSDIKEILGLEYWNDEKYKPLLTSGVWKSNPGDIKEMLGLEYWKDEKYRLLLTSGVWNSNPGDIKEILGLEYWEDEKYKPLLTSSIWNSNASDIKEILGLEYWKDEKYKPLLTSSIWKSNAGRIHDVLNLSVWNDSKYTNLLSSPKILTLVPSNIVDNITTCEERGMALFSNNKSLIINLTNKELNAKINYINYHGLDLITDKGKPNSIFSMSNKNMQANYGISKQEMVRQYSNEAMSKRGDKGNAI